MNEEAKIVNALTVDVEDYFHTEAMSTVVGREEWDGMPSRVEANTRRLFDLLARHNVHTTMFFLGWVAEHHPALVREAAELGHEIGCHSYWHRPIFRLTPAEFREDTRRAKSVIESAGGAPVRGYRAPSFSLVPGTEWAADILAELGFTYDSSVHPVRHDLYNNPHAPRTAHRIANGALLELPLATVRLLGSNFSVAGGGYLRMLPYGYVRWGLTRVNRLEGRPAVVYLHPWEIDPEQPRLTARGKAKARQYKGLEEMERKLVRLLGDFSFGTIASAYKDKLGADASAELVRKPGRQPADEGQASSNLTGVTES